MIGSTPLLKLNEPYWDSSTRHSAWIRFFLMGLLFLAFARLTWQLDAKSLWIDEAFSLERVRHSWHDLLVGRIVITDGVIHLPSTDQHPFAYFIFLGTWIRLAGIDEFMLRFPSVIAATLMVPTFWVLARVLVRHQALPRATAYFAVLFAALSPFYLWYGQEVRMYMFWAFLAALSSYTLLRWQDAQTKKTRRRWLIAYALTLALFVFTQYYSVLLLPVHALIFFQRLLHSSRRKAILAATVILILALLLGIYAIRQVFTTPISGSNFVAISLQMLIPDLVNAFGLGLSVDLANVWWLDLIFGGMALLGALWALRSREKFLRLGWFLPAFILVPVTLLLVVNLIHPAYMNARHISLISPAFLLLVAAGVAWLWQLRREIGGIIALLLLAGMGYSTYAYFYDPQYTKGDLAAMGDYVSREFQPGDWLLVNPAPMLPLYRYYLPVEAAEHAATSGWLGVPLLHRPQAETEALLESGRQQHSRIWLISGDPDTYLDDWLRSHGFQIRDIGFHSPISWLRAQLFVSELPIYTEPFQRPIQHPLNVVFGDQIRLLGYDVGTPLTAESVTPITLYWQPVTPIERRYKYKLQLVASQDGTPVERSVTEREPYDGFLPTIHWPMEHTIVEYSELLIPAHLPSGNYQLHLTWYDPETLQLLPVTNTPEESNTLVLPFPEQP